MRILASLSQNEEKVRQLLIEALVHLGYPRSLIAVEKSLSAFVEGKVPNRRLDIVVTSKEGAPLMAIECKAVPINQSTFDQLIGYNHYLKAPFIAVANANEVQFGWLEEDGYKFMPGLPKYSEVVAAVS